MARAQEARRGALAEAAGKQRHSRSGENGNWHEGLCRKCTKRTVERCQKRLGNKGIRARAKMATGTKVCGESAQSALWGVARNDWETKAFALGRKWQPALKVGAKALEIRLERCWKQPKNRALAPSGKCNRHEGCGKCAKSTPWALAEAAGRQRRPRQAENATGMEVEAGRKKCAVGTLPETAGKQRHSRSGENGNRHGG